MSDIEIKNSFEPIIVVKNRIKITQVPNGGIWISAPTFSKKLNSGIPFKKEELIKLVDVYLEKEEEIQKYLEEHIFEICSKKQDKEKILADEKIWSAVCSGEKKDIEYAREYILKYGANSFRKEAFGKKHSLIMGALRNNNYEMVNVLVSLGETLLPEETNEIFKFFMEEK